MWTTPTSAARSPLPSGSTRNVGIGRPWRREGGGPLAETSRAQVRAHRFASRQLGWALAVHDALPASDPGRRGRRWMLVSALLGLSLLAGSGVIGLIDPQPVWQRAAVLIDTGSGAVFVNRDGILHPALNLTSALLAATGSGSDRPAVTPVDADLIRSVPRGAPIGIPGAPGQLPAPDALVDGNWAVCDDAGVAPGGSGGAGGGFYRSRRRPRHRAHRAAGTRHAVAEHGGSARQLEHGRGVRSPDLERPPRTTQRERPCRSTGAAARRGATPPGERHASRRPPGERTGGCSGHRSGGVFDSGFHRDVPPGSAAAHRGRVPDPVGRFRIELPPRPRRRCGTDLGADGGSDQILGCRGGRAGRGGPAGIDRRSDRPSRTGAFRQASRKSPGVRRCSRSTAALCQLVGGFRRVDGDGGPGTVDIGTAGVAVEVRIQGQSRDRTLARGGGPRGPARRAARCRRSDLPDHRPRGCVPHQRCRYLATAGVHRCRDGGAGCHHPGTARRSGPECPSGAAGSKPRREHSCGHRFRASGSDRGARRRCAELRDCSRDVDVIGNRFTGDNTGGVWPSGMRVRSIPRPQLRCAGPFGTGPGPRRPPGAVMPSGQPPVRPPRAGWSGSIAVPG